MSSIHAATAIIHARQGAELIARVFDTWDAWIPDDTECAHSVCPGCGNWCTNMETASHEPYCWFAEAASWLRAMGIDPPDLFKFTPYHSKGTEQPFDE